MKRENSAETDTSRSTLSRIVVRLNYTFFQNWPHSHGKCCVLILTERQPCWCCTKKLTEWAPCLCTYWTDRDPKTSNRWGRAVYWIQHCMIYYRINFWSLILIFMVCLEPIQFCMYMYCSLQLSSLQATCKLQSQILTLIMFMTEHKLWGKLKNCSQDICANKKNHIKNFFKILKQCKI